MICPRCKTEVSQNDAVCPTCKLRLIFKCPRCQSPTRLGSVSCKKCGYTFVKFCPKCHSANYATSSICRKCNHVFESENTTPIKQEELKIIKKALLLEKTSEENAKKTAAIEAQKAKTATATVENNGVINNQRPLLFYIDFINLEATFEKYKKEEFKLKVIQNIKTTVKIVFNTNCEFVNAHCIIFKYNYSKSSKMLEKIKQFEDEFSKFNQILEKTLDTGLSYKFAISTVEEVKRSNNNPQQLKFGSNRDVIVSSGVYPKLSNELSLIKVSSDSYKMLYVEQKPVFEQTEDKKYDKALEIMLDNLTDNNSQIRAISLNAPRGVGKTHLLNDLYYRVNRIKSQNTLVLYAQCSALTQVSPYGLIQSFFSSFFDCPAVLGEETIDEKEFEKKVLEKLRLDTDRKSVV